MRRLRGMFGYPAAALLAAVALVLSAACGNAGSPPGSRPAAQVGGGAPSPAAVTGCLEHRGAVVTLKRVAGMRQIHGRLPGASFDVLVFPTPRAARTQLEAIIGLAGGTTSVDGVPVEQMVKRSGAIIVLYAAQPAPSAARVVEACFGDHARLDPDILAALRPTPSCSGAFGSAVDQLGRYPQAASWKPERIDGGGCAVRFASSEPSSRVVEWFRARLGGLGWTAATPTANGGLLCMFRGDMVITLEREPGATYTLYARSAMYGE